MILRLRRWWHQLWRCDDYCGYLEDEYFCAPIEVNVETLNISTSPFTRLFQLSSSPIGATGVMWLEDEFMPQMMALHFDIWGDWRWVD